MTQPQRITYTLDLQKELLNNVTPNTNFLFGKETIQTARNYRNISGHSKTTTPIFQLTGVTGKFTDFPVCVIRNIFIRKLLHLTISSPFISINQKHA